MSFSSIDDLATASFFSADAVFAVFSIEVPFFLVPSFLVVVFLAAVFFAFGFSMIKEE